MLLQLLITALDHIHNSLYHKLHHSVTQHVVHCVSFMIESLVEISLQSQITLKPLFPDRSVSFRETVRRKNFSSLVISVLPSISVLELCFGHFSLRKFTLKFRKFQCNYFSSFCEPSLFFGLFKNPVVQVFDKESKCLSTGTYYKAN
jgi:hypothetical protein